MSAGGVFQEKEARSSEPAAFPQPPRADDSGDLALHGLAAHAPRSRCGKVGAVQHPAESRALSGILNIECTRIVGRVLGVVSEADIILKAASRPESAGMLGRFFTPKAVDERHLAATTAGEAMTAPAVTIGADQSVAEAARLMVEHQVNRLPVLVNGKLAGIVSRADIVRAFTRSDSEIWEELRNHIIPTKLWILPEELDLTVSGAASRSRAG